MESGPKPRRDLAKVSLIISLLIIGGLVFWIFVGSYRFGLPQPLPSGSPINMLVRSVYVNNTGGIHGTLNAQGVNITVSDTNGGSTISTITPAYPTTAKVIVGRTYIMEATLGMSSREVTGIIGGYGSILEVLVWDNRTISSVSYANVTP